MPADNVAFVGSIPENYDRYLGPVLFEPYAPEIEAALAEKIAAQFGAAPVKARMRAIVCTGVR